MSLAHAYAMKKQGACASHGKQGCEMCHGGQAMAEGGPVEGGAHADVSSKEWGGGARRGTSVAGEHVRGAAMAKANGQYKAEAARMGRAKEIHKQNLDEMQSDTQDRTNLAHGGYAEDGDDLDMISHIMRKRMSKGGQATNDTLDPGIEDDDAQYDDLVKDDDLEFHDTGANSGDEVGDAQEDMDRDDMISMIMASRKKKDRMPRPA